MSDKHPFSGESLDKRIKTLEVAVHTLANAPRQQHATRPGPESTSAQKNNPAGGQTLLALQVPPAPPNTAQANNPWYKTLQGWSHLLQMIGIPFAIGYAIVTYRQWHDLRHNFEVDQRAWVSVETKISNDLTSAVPVSAQIKNVGKSVALKIDLHAVVEVVDKDKPPSFSPMAFARLIHFNPLFPSDSRKTYIERGKLGNIPPIPLTTAEIDSLRSGRSYLVVYGAVMYFDQFGYHWTRFCNWQPYADVIFPAAESCIDYSAIGDGYSDPSTTK